ncbi:MAG TPA: inositol monophosphatase family protein [Steroidobacteraceae bacterium]|nr:inositol monophosphatase family protein [Steroidobacteraceae bacterium]
MDVLQLKPLLEAALEAAQAAEVPIRRYFRASEIGLVSKSDGSPVTRADREAEAAIRARLAVAPGGPFDILGEEEGLAGDGTRYRWVVDPIDGTRSFVRGMPLFGTMIGLEDTADGSALLGVIHLPILGVTYAGGRGLGATRNGQVVRLPESVALEDSIISTGDVAYFDEAGMREAYLRLVAMHGYVRGYTDCFGHGLAIEGALDAMVDPALNPWDIRATQAIVEAAGGAVVVRPSRAAGKFDVVLGNRALVTLLARELGSPCS